jgi:hypothetical protein
MTMTTTLTRNACYFFFNILRKGTNTGRKERFEWHMAEGTNERILIIHVVGNRSRNKKEKKKKKRKKK